MNIEERMFFEAILEQLKTVDQRLTDIERRIGELADRVTPTLKWDSSCPGCGEPSYCICPATAAPTPLPCSCAPYEYCADCNPEEFKHGPK